MKELLDKDVTDAFLRFVSALEERGIVVNVVELERATRRNAGTFFGIGMREKFAEQYDIVRREDS